MRPNQKTNRSLLLIAITAGAVGTAQAYEAHEWGTFTSLVGSNGVTQNGMYHEDEALPSFVHPYGETQAATTPKPPPRFREPGCHFKMCMGNEFFTNNVITQKMETPVIYFYSDKPENVEVNVKFPEGLITETFPAPVTSLPGKTNPAPEAKNGTAVFKVDVLAQKTSSVIPFADNANIYSHARRVASNVVRSGSEQEKFIFYRGIGRFQPRISITSNGGSLAISGEKAAMPAAAFLVHVDENGNGQMIDLGNLQDKGQASISSAMLATLKDHGSVVTRANILRGNDSKNHLVASLMNAGLNADEALGMVNTWEHGYLKVPGLRLLYTLPTSEVDAILPLTMTPEPTDLRRVFVARIEVMLDTEEQQLLQKIVASNFHFDVGSLGRFAEPMLRRVQESYAKESTADSAVVRYLEQLVNQAFAGETSSAAVQ